jgi:predicted RNA binding protein YcfA (HicA-like mRNA interferase family)
MPRLPRISAKKVIKTLEKMGFVKSRQTGSHVVLKTPSPRLNEQDLYTSDFQCN